MQNEESDNLLDNFLSAAIELNTGPSIELGDLDKGNSVQLSDDFDKALSEAAAEKCIRKASLLMKETRDNVKSDLRSDNFDDDDDLNDYGKSINLLLESSKKDNVTTDFRRDTNTWISKTKSDIKQLKVARPVAAATSSDSTYTSMFSIRVVKPLVSSTTIEQMVEGKDVVQFIKLKYYITKKSFDKDWVITGVITNKFSKTSQAGNLFTIWTITDMQHDMRTVGIFLFGNAQKQMSKLTVGTAVGILNPSILEKKSGSKDEVHYYHLI